MDKRVIEELIKWPIIEQETIDKCVDYLNSGKISISSGDVLDEFESNFSKFVNIKHCLLHNNGTSALFAAYYALGLQAGDYVMVPNFTWTATVTPLLPLGLIPVFCDVDYSLNISVEDMEKKYSKKVKAVVVVHMWGNPCDMHKILQFVKKYNLYLIEDCSHAHGATFQGKQVGSFGDISCFSMQATKILPGGELGIAVTNCYEYYAKMIKLGQQGRINSLLINENAIGGLGYKFRPFPLAVIIANDQLKKLKYTNNVRRMMAQVLEDKMNTNSSVKVIEKNPDSERVYYSYVFEYVGNDNINEVINRCNKKNIPLSKMRYNLISDVEPFTIYKAETPIIKSQINNLLMIDMFNKSDKLVIEELSEELNSLV